jgi:hypothetical protein
MSITLEHYLMGRDQLFPDQYTPEIDANAQHTLGVVNALLERMAADGVVPPEPVVASGWRTAQINERTSNAAAHSKHLTAQACDLHDTPDRALARWAIANEAAMRECGVEGMERPQWTPTWLHVQTVAVASGHFCYVPSSAPPAAAALLGEKEAA